MRVLLIVPTYKYKYIYPSFMANTDFPVGFAYLSSSLKQGGHEVFGLNLNNDTSYSSSHEMIHERINQSLQFIKPDLIAMGGLCTDFKFLDDATKIIRKSAPDIPLVIGGGIINNDPEFIFNTLRSDFCVVGEGEEVLVNLANFLESGNRNYEDIPNLGYWNDGIAKFTKNDYKYIDINDRPFPDYDPFGIKEMMNDYSMAARYSYRYIREIPRPMTIVTARGCPFKCTFCVHNKGPSYRARTMNNIMQEIGFLYEKYQFNILLILDELFAAKKDRIIEFSNLLIDARKNRGWDFNWAFQTHASADLDRHTLTIAKEAGCYNFGYGFESASPTILKSMNKKSKPAQIENAIKLAESVNLGYGGNIIFGDVAETEKTVSETLNFFFNHCQDIHVAIYFIQLYPGSKLFETGIQRGLIKDKLEYYHTIDEKIWNLTLFPNKLWLPWIYLLYFLAKPYPWTKVTYAMSVTEEKESTDSPMVTHSAKAIYHVDATCPHCSSKIHYRELLDKPNCSIIKKHHNHAATKSCLTNINNLKILMMKLFFENLFLYLISIRHPIFKLLKNFTNPDEMSTFFITGCTHCNKRIKIYLPTLDKGNSFKSMTNRFIRYCIKIAIG